MPERYSIIYENKGYDIEIYKANDDTYIADIKYPCGELLEGKTCFKSKKSAREWVDLKLVKLKPTKNHCDNEYCTE